MPQMPSLDPSHRSAVIALDTAGALATLTRPVVMGLDASDRACVARAIDACWYGNAALAVVNTDDFADLSDAVDWLLSFRRQHPGARVVICSRRFSRDEAGGHRAPIADVSLCLPLSDRRMQAALANLRPLN